MVGQVVRDHAEVRLQVRILEEVPPLPPIRAGGVLHDQRDPAAGLLEVDLAC